MPKDAHFERSVQEMDRAYDKLVDALSKIDREVGNAIDAAGVLVMRSSVISGKNGKTLGDNAERARQMLGKIYDIIHGERLNNAATKAFQALSRGVPSS